MQDYKNSIQFLAEMCEEVTINNTDNDNEIGKLSQEIKFLWNNRTKEKTNWRQWNNFRYANKKHETQLIIHGHWWTKFERRYVGRYLRTFLKEHMKISHLIKFHTVHRIGWKREGQNRPIVADFVYLKDKEKFTFSGNNTQRHRLQCQWTISKRNRGQKRIIPSYEEGKRKPKKTK